MIADLKPYPEYKDSGLPWLGQVPAHWEVRPAFGAFVPNHERNQGMKEKTVLSLSYGRIVIKPAEKLHGLVPESFETYQIVNPGDIVLRTTDLQNDHTSLRVGIVRDRGIITSAYLALRVKAGVRPDFGFQFLNVWDSSKAIYGYGSGLRQNLDFSHFKRMPVAVPLPSEQAAIVRFLDWANGRLERAIRAKRKIVALLNEQKQAIIHRAVTRGLDPNVRLKPSGIPWLGEIPEHWGVRRLKNIKKPVPGSFVDGPFGSNLKSIHYVTNGEAYVVESGFITSGEFVQKEFKTITLEHYRTIARSSCRGGDIIIAKIGAYYGRAGILPELDKPAVVSGNALKLTVDETIVDNRFVHLALLTARVAGALEFIVNATAQPALSLSAMNELALPLPPKRDQLDIIGGLSLETKSVVAAISRLEREITLLREYRTRLVADVVTGKLDVRAAAAALPDEAPLDAAPEEDLDSPDADESLDEEEDL